MCLPCIQTQLPYASASLDLMHRFPIAGGSLNPIPNYEKHGLWVVWTAELIQFEFFNSIIKMNQSDFENQTRSEKKPFCERTIFRVIKKESFYLTVQIVSGKKLI